MAQVKLAMEPERGPALLQEHAQSGQVVNTDVSSASPPG